MRNPKRKPKTEAVVPIQTETNGEKKIMGEGRFIRGGLIRPGHEMWTNNWTIYIGGMKGTKENPLPSSAPTKQEPTGEKSTTERTPIASESPNTKKRH
jgi:hypothetical protein